MNKSIVAEGKTTAEAVEKGLKELGVSKDKVEIKVLEEEKRSFYSILSPRVVKVELNIKEGVEKEKKNQEKEPVAVFEKKEPREKNENNDEINEGVNGIKEFLKSFLDTSVEYTVEVKDFDIYITINGEESKHLIGYRGETINALQHIITSIANKKSTNKIRTYVDIEGYRNKRIKTLEELAEKIARTVIRTGKEVTLEPMTAYERKIIHSKLQENNRVKTFSKGEEPYRKIVVALK